MDNNYEIQLLRKVKLENRTIIIHHHNIVFLLSFWACRRVEGSKGSMANRHGWLKLTTV